jgi:putative transcriptional regulator
LQPHYFRKRALALFLLPCFKEAFMPIFPIFRKAIIVNTMNITAGTFLSSLPSLDDTNFEQAVILITEHNEKGAMGFVVNKLFPRKLNELEEFRHIPAFPIYEGGPVEQEHLFFIHRRPDLIQGGFLISGAVYLGGDFKQATACIGNKTITEKDLKIFIGYCGWDDEQLEEEIEEGSWQIEENVQDAFS